MFNVKYSFSTSQNKDVDYKIADEMEISYYLFMGNVSLNTQSSKISLNFIPLFDFVSCFLSIYWYLSKQDEVIVQKEFEFTNSDKLLFILKNGDNISVSTCYSEEKIEMSFEEFGNGLKTYFLSLIDEIKNRYEGIESNSIYMEEVKALHQICNTINSK